MLHGRAAGLVQEGRDLLLQGSVVCLELREQMYLSDQVAALCLQALYFANGFGAVDTPTAFAGELALEALAGELELSEATSHPLKNLRSRVAALVGGAAPDAMDSFVAFQGHALAQALLDWTDTRLAELVQNEAHGLSVCNA